MEKQRVPSTRLHNFPPQLTPFVGRAAELNDLVGLLAEPSCRLLTLTGPGGIGKTRLAMEAAARGSAEFSHGACFISLQPVQSIEFLASAIAAVLPFPLSGQEPAQTQLLNYLAGKEMLLLLDNFEHLISTPETDSLLPASLQHALETDIAGAETSPLTAILTAAPGVKLLVTSRELLNLQGEWLYQVGGLDFPASPPAAPDQAEKIEAYGAVQLFIERAKRARQSFSLAGEQPAVVHICQLVEGAPLAIELAAAWIKTMRCDQIAAEIARNINFLASNLRNVPARQQSIRAVFDHSWRLLAEQERRLFRRLSVFRGGFRRIAAEQIAGASLVTLTSLVDKSLLRWNPDGRYQMHDLLRQYAAEQLAYQPEEMAQVYEWHCAYFADFLQTRSADMMGGRQQEAAAEIEAELENVQAAWQWAVAQAKIEEINKSLESLDLFYQFRGRYLEGMRAFKQVVQNLRSITAPVNQASQILPDTLVDLAWYYVRLGRLEEAETLFVEAQDIYQRLNLPTPSGYSTDPRLGLGIIASIRGDYAAAARLGEMCRQTSESHNHQWNRQLAYYLLARAALLQGQYETAQQYALQAYAVTQETGDRWFMAYCLNELGHLAAILDDDAGAKGYYQAGYAIRKEFGDPEGMALALNYLAEIALRQQDYTKAEGLYRQSLTIYQEINDRGGLAASQAGLGQTALAAGDYETARSQLHQALQIAADMAFIPLAFSILIGIAKLLKQIEQPEEAVSLLAFSSRHPAADQVVKDKAERLLDDYSASLPAAAFVAACQLGQSTALETMLARAQMALTLPLEAGPGRSETAGEAPPSPASRPSISQALVEPLTPRELEVLQLIAEGLTNRDIADRLSVVVGTVKAHNNSIYGKLGVSNRVQALARARELNLL